MPTGRSDSYEERVERFNKAKERVLRKFPNIVVGSSGWFRALKAYL